MIIEMKLIEQEKRTVIIAYGEDEDAKKEDKDNFSNFCKTE